MAWSGGLASIRLPYDAVPGGGRNYVDIGEEVPPELSSAFTAGLFFRTGSDPAYPNGFDYWAVGITGNGTLEIVGRYYVVPFPGQAPVYTRQTVFSVSPPIAVDNLPVITIGAHPDYSSFRESGVETRDAGHTLASLTQTAASGLYPAGFGVIALQAIDWDTEGGVARASGVTYPNGGFTIQRNGYYRLSATVPITSIPAGAYVCARFVVNGNFHFGKTAPLTQAGFAGDAGAQTGEQIYQLHVGDYVQLQGYCSAANWKTRVTGSSDGIAASARLTYERPL